MDRKRRESPEHQWEQALIKAYHDHRWRETLEPLYDKFQRWKAGELGHAEMDRAIHETHKQTQEVYKFFIQKRSVLLKFIQWDREWFAAWVKNHAPPSGIDLAPSPPWASEEVAQ